MRCFWGTSNGTIAWTFGELTLIDVPMTTAAKPVTIGVALPVAITAVKSAIAPAVTDVQVMYRALRSMRSDQAPAGSDRSIAGSPRAIAISPSADSQSVRVTMSQMKANRSVPLTPVYRTLATKKLR